MLQHIDFKRLSKYDIERNKQYEKEQSSFNNYEIAKNELAFRGDIGNRYHIVSAQLDNFNPNKILLNSNILDGGDASEAINALVTSDKDMIIPNTYSVQDFSDIQAIGIFDNENSFNDIGYFKLIKNGQIEKEYKRSNYNGLNNIVTRHGLAISGMIDGDLQWINPWDNRRINTMPLDVLEMFNCVYYDRDII